MLKRKSVRFLSKKNKQIIKILIFLFTCLYLGIGYAYLNKLLVIDETINSDNSSLNIYFENIVPKAKNLEGISSTIIKDKTSLDMNVSLEKPGDTYSFDIDIVNKGAYDAVLTEINKSELSIKQQEYFEYTIKHSNNRKISKNEILKKNSRATLNITLKYKDKAKSIKDDETIDLSLTLIYKNKK